MTILLVPQATALPRATLSLRKMVLYVNSMSYSNIGGSNYSVSTLNDRAELFLKHEHRGWYSGRRKRARGGVYLDRCTKALL